MSETQKKLIAFGNGLKLLRKFKNLNQADFAAIFDLTPSSISRFEGATAIPNLDTALKLAAFFNLTPEGVMAFGCGGKPKESPPAPEVAEVLAAARAVLEAGGQDAETLKHMLDLMQPKL